jgi:hypothetical protein
MATVAGHALYFEGGSRWRGVRVVGHEPALLSPGGSSPLCRTEVFTLRSTAKGRPWSTRRPMGFWRNFAAIDSIAGDPAEVVRFVSRHGDPSGALNNAHAAGEPLVTETSSWFQFIFWLARAAAAWDPPDAEGISRRSDDAARLAEAWTGVGLLAPLDLPKPPGNAEYVITTRAVGKGPFVIQAKTLRMFMVLSAGAMLDAATPMRTCNYCGDWFDVRRKGAGYCSPACQATDYQIKAKKGQ